VGYCGESIALKVDHPSHQQVISVYAEKLFANSCFTHEAGLQKTTHGISKDGERRLSEHGRIPGVSDRRSWQQEEHQGAGGCHGILHCCCRAAAPAVITDHPSYFEVAS
jgi:hypothetical protein